MKNLILSAFVLCCGSMGCETAPPKQAEEQKSVTTTTTEVAEITFTTPDGIRIVGDLYERKKEDPTILLFHQAGSNARGEYGPIIPRLIMMGYNVLAIDQRSGGQQFGSYNRTIAQLADTAFYQEYGYCDAYNNLEGALDFIMEQGFTGTKIIWGSSYSAALVVQLAHSRPDDLAGALAFSPASGGPLAECKPDDYFSTITIPLLILRPPSEMEREPVQLQADLARSFNHEVFVGEYGRHGSSMLVQDRVGHEVEDTWAAVTTFLKNIK